MGKSFSTSSTSVEALEHYRDGEQDNQAITSTKEAVSRIGDSLRKIDRPEISNPDDLFLAEDVVQRMAGLTELIATKYPDAIQSMLDGENIPEEIAEVFEDDYSEASDSTRSLLNAIMSDTLDGLRHIANAEDSEESPRSEEYTYLQRRLENYASRLSHSIGEYFDTPGGKVELEAFANHAPDRVA